MLKKVLNVQVSNKRSDAIFTEICYKKYEKKKENIDTSERLRRTAFISFRFLSFFVNVFLKPIFLISIIRSYTLLFFSK